MREASEMYSLAGQLIPRKPCTARKDQRSLEATGPHAMRRQWGALLLQVWSPCALRPAEGLACPPISGPTSDILNQNVRGKGPRIFNFNKLFCYS